MLRMKPVHLSIMLVVFASGQLEISLSDFAALILCTV